VSNINVDLAKSFGRRADKIRSSFGLRQDWQDETSELYADLVSRFAKQGISFPFSSKIAIQVQVLVRDLDRWVKEYRLYLNSADSLIGALKSWMTFETHTHKNFNPRNRSSWDIFFSHIESVSTQIFPILESTIRAKCIEPLQVVHT
jgi:hypothetical protein